MITLLGKRELDALLFFFFFFVFALCAVCHGWFALSLGAIGRLCSVTVAISGQPLYYFDSFRMCPEGKFSYKVAQLVIIVDSFLQGRKMRKQEMNAP